MLLYEVIFEENKFKLTQLVDLTKLTDGIYLYNAGKSKIFVSESAIVKRIGGKYLLDVSPRKRPYEDIVETFDGERFKTNDILVKFNIEDLDYDVILESDTNNNLNFSNSKNTFKDKIYHIQNGETIKIKRKKDNKTVFILNNSGNIPFYLNI